MKNLWNQKKILVGISSGIAAYKLTFLVRDLVKKGADVRVVLSPNAQEFVSKLTLSTLSKNKVISEFYTTDAHWNNHVELALWADAILIAPATANTLAKMAQGLCDNFLIATYLSAKCPVFFAPTMDLDMHEHPSTKNNIRLLQSFGNYLIPSEFGALASGLVGNGRMAEPETMISIMENYFESKEKFSNLFKNKKILISAGPTYEAIDPVRFIGNHSSGKMGFALAQAALDCGAEVVLVTGPTHLNLQNANLKLQRVQSAREMQSAVLEHYDDCDIAIMSAAVADYAPKEQATQKIKKKEETMTLELVKTPDILKELGQKKQHQFLVGFALETQNEEDNARSKLENKNLDLIVLNSLQDQGAGFQTDTNKVKLITKDNKNCSIELKNKAEVAKDILLFIDELI